MLENISIKKKLFGIIPVILVIVIVIISLSYRTTISSIRNVAESNLGAMVTQFKLLIKHDKSIDKTFISNLCNKQLKIGKKGFVFIIDSDGTLFVHKKAQGENWANKPHIKKILNMKNGNIRYLSPKTGTMKIASFQYCRKLDKIIVASVFEDDLIGEVKAKLFRTAVVRISIVSVVVFLFLFFVVKSIVLPITTLISTLRKTIGDDTETLDLRYRTNIETTDELGDLGKAFDALMDKIQALVAQNISNSKKLYDFSKEQSAITSQMVASTEEMSSQSGTIASSTNQASSNMTNIASATEEMSTSVSVVATAIEEMSSTVNEISKNCQKESEVANVANTQAKDTNDMMKKLEISASEIGKVLDVIKDIADQTNLLALNATIEAASAGDAGKGFAVVANEVKELAKQTALATDEIGKQIEDMRSNTNSSVKAIEDITAIIEEVNTISQTIVSAVEEQSATINEISKNVSGVSEASNEVAKNVQESAKGLGEISSNVSGFNQAIGEITGGMNQVEKSTAQLSSMAKELKESTDKFKCDC